MSRPATSLGIPRNLGADEEKSFHLNAIGRRIAPHPNAKEEDHEIINSFNLAESPGYLPSLSFYDVTRTNGFRLIDPSG